uniref:Nlr family card domain protein n=1 Tax=Rhipicephalus zambeziensis TaxID=60191 RepID=A0A224YUR1_9ACAR
MRRNRTLRTLNLTSEGVRSFNLVRPMVQTLLSNRCITELTISWLTLTDEDVDLINQLLSRNRTLTRFNLIECKWDKAQRQNGTDGEHRTGNSVGVPSRIDSFLVALSKNKTLQELSLTPSWFNTNECRSLFETVSSHASLKKVKLEVCEREDAVEIYRALRETGAQDRFFLGTHRALRENEVALTQSNKPSGVGVDEYVFYGYAQLLATLTLQPSHSHVTSLWLLLERDLLNPQVSSVIAQYIAGTKTLRDLKLRFRDADFGDVVHDARRELVLALSVNASVRKLEVRGSWSEEAEIRLLADTVLCSRALCHVSFNPDERESAVSLVRMLSPTIAGNYTLLSMRPEDHVPYSDRWFRVNNVTRRNCALVTRAAHFVTGTKEKYCAAAVELVHYNPGLVEKVQELASVDEMKAASLIKASLKKISELDAFMRLAGVVKYGVTCHSRDDGKKQLVDIGRDCWLHLRQFIKLDDILN